MILNYRNLLNEVLSSQKSDRTMTWSIIQVCSMPKMILNCQDLSDQERFVMKNKQDNNMIDRTYVVYAKNDSELSWPIKQDFICDENKKEQQCDWSYKCNLHWKQYWIIMIDRVRCDLWQKKWHRIMTWLIVQLWSTLKLNKIVEVEWARWAL